jgi:hypothetical protein
VTLLLRDQLAMTQTGVEEGQNENEKKEEHVRPEGLRGERKG